jgi:diazepam-binding inhibitor (GABA receptor modulating acyl-CoA-binding protein)
MDSELDNNFIIYSNKYNKISKIDTVIHLHDKLHMYGLYKQAQFGDVTTLIPSLFDVMNRKKWVSWHYFNGKSKESAKKDYIQYYEYIIKKYNITEE